MIYLLPKADGTYMGQTRNPISRQHTKMIIFDVPKSSMPQETRWQCTFIMTREVHEIFFCVDVPFSFNNLSSSHPIMTTSCRKTLFKFFDQTCEYYGFVECAQDTSCSFATQENREHHAKKVRISKKVEPNGANSRRFEIRSICKV